MLAQRTLRMWPALKDQCDPFKKIPELWKLGCLFPNQGDYLEHPGLEKPVPVQQTSRPPLRSWPCRQNMTFLRCPEYILFLVGGKAMEKGQFVYSYSLWHPGSLASCCDHNTNNGNNFRCCCFRSAWSSSGIPSWRLTSKHYRSSEEYAIQCYSDSCSVPIWIVSVLMIKGN